MQLQVVLADLVVFDDAATPAESQGIRQGGAAVQTNPSKQYNRLGNGKRTEFDVCLAVFLRRLALGSAAY